MRFGEQSIRLQLETNKPLDQLHTMACQSQADHYVAVQSVDELQEALAYARGHRLAVHILGGGSNLVFADKVAGLVIHLHLLGKEVLGSQEADHCLVKVAAGEDWHRFVRWTLQQGLRGLENLSLIPGTVGAAPIQNIGAYGVEVESCIHRVEAFHQADGTQHSFAKSDCVFGYRDSIFKRQGNPWIITAVIFQFFQHTPLTPEYAELNKRWLSLGAPDDPLVISELVCQIRQEKLPDPKDVPNSGSFFKNPLVSNADYRRLKQLYPKLVAYPAGQQWKLAAGWLIQETGWKGNMHNGVGMYEKQALVLVNPGKKSGSEVLKYAQLVKASVKEKFGVLLEQEPVVIR